MREIKLKAYSKKYRHLNIIELKLYNWEISFVVCQDEKGKFIDFTEDEIKKWEIIFRQYTWMKDINWKEVFDGDIVLYNWKKYVVKYWEFNYWCDFCDVWYIWYYMLDNDGVIENMWITTEVEVIWNTYDNKDLLNSNK